MKRTVIFVGLNIILLYKITVLFVFYFKTIEYIVFITMAAAISDTKNNIINFIIRQIFLIITNYSITIFQV